MALYECWNDACSRYAEAGKRLRAGDVYADRVGRLHCMACHRFVRVSGDKNGSVTPGLLGGGLLGFAIGGPIGAAIGAGLAAVLGAPDDVQPMRRLTAFVSFAAEDARARDLFVGQSKNPNTPWSIRDESITWK